MMSRPDVDGFFRVYVDQGRYNISILSGGMSHDINDILLRTLLNYRLRLRHQLCPEHYQQEYRLIRPGLPPRRLVWPLRQRPALRLRRRPLRMPATPP